MNLNQQVASFILSRRAAKVSDKTVKHYQFCLGLLTEHFAEATPLDRDDLRRYFVWLQERCPSASTAKAAAVASKAFARWLYEEQLLPKDITAGIKTPAAQKVVLTTFTDAEADKIVETTKKSPRDRALVMTALNGGLRRSELAALKVSDVNLDMGRLVVRKGKGNKRRTVSIGKHTCAALRAYMGNSGSVFTGQRGALTPAGVESALTAIGKRAGVHANPHRFRRYYAFRRLREGIDLHTLAMLMGHEDISMLKQYLSFVDDDVIAIAEKFSPLTA